MNPANRGRSLLRLPGTMPRNFAPLRSPPDEPSGFSHAARFPSLWPPSLASSLSRLRGLSPPLVEPLLGSGCESILCAPRCAQRCLAGWLFPPLTPAGMRECGAGASATESELGPQPKPPQHGPRVQRTPIMCGSHNLPSAVLGPWERGEKGKWHARYRAGQAEGAPRGLPHLPSPGEFFIGTRVRAVILPGGESCHRGESSHIFRAASTSTSTVTALAFSSLFWLFCSIVSV